MHLHVWETRSLIFFLRVSHTCLRVSICVTSLIHICDMSREYAWHDTHVNDSGHTYEWFISHIYEWFISHIRMICGVSSQALATWLTNMCDMVHLHCDMDYCNVWHSILPFVTCLMDICDMTHGNVWRDSIKSVKWCRSREGVTWLNDMRDMTHWNVWHDSSTCVTWLNDMRDMTNRNV